MRLRLRSIVALVLLIALSMWAGMQIERSRSARSSARPYVVMRPVRTVVRPNVKYTVMRPVRRTRPANPMRSAIPKD